MNAYHAGKRLDFAILSDKWPLMNAGVTAVDLDAPDMLQQVERLHKIVDDEKARRKHFYETFTEQEKVEFINGEVVFQSPAKLWQIQMSGQLYRLLSSYVGFHELGIVAREKLMISLNRDDYEPHLSLFSAEKAATFMPRQMQFPAPDFIVEVISPRTAECDRESNPGTTPRTECVSIGSLIPSCTR